MKTPDVIEGGMSGYRIKKENERASDTPEIDRLRDRNTDLERRLADYEALRAEVIMLRMQVAIVPACKHTWVAAVRADYEFCVACKDTRPVSP